jgi:hypothetical protein
MKQAVMRTGLFGLILLLLGSAPGQSQVGGPAQPAKVTPKLEPIAETKLLMNGLAHANFRGLERTLTEKPSEAQAWVFARGQALLLAETANLLMLRPPKNQGQPVWFERSADLRKQATQLAVTISQRDYAASKTGLQQVAATCNRCHQTFRVDAEITPFVQPPPPKVE